MNNVRKPFKNTYLSFVAFSFRKILVPTNYGNKRVFFQKNTENTVFRQTAGKKGRNCGQTGEKRILILNQKQVIIEKGTIISDLVQMIDDRQGVCEEDA